MRKPWTEEDKDWLLAEGRAMTAQDAAAHLGRTPDSVRGMLRLLGLGKRHKPKFWTPERCDRLAELYTTGVSRRDICRSLNITITSLETQASKLGLLRPAPKGPKEPRGPHCPTCFIGAEHMAGCPRPECSHYAEPMGRVEYTLAGIGSAL